MVYESHGIFRKAVENYWGKKKFRSPNKILETERKILGDSLIDDPRINAILSEYHFELALRGRV